MLEVFVVFEKYLHQKCSDQENVMTTLNNTIIFKIYANRIFKGVRSRRLKNLP